MNEKQKQNFILFLLSSATVYFVEMFIFLFGLLIYHFVVYRGKPPRTAPIQPEGKQTGEVTAISTLGPPEKAPIVVKTKVKNKTKKKKETESPQKTCHTQLEDEAIQLESPPAQEPTQTEVSELMQSTQRREPVEDMAVCTTGTGENTQEDSMKDTQYRGPATVPSAPTTNTARVFVSPFDRPPSTVPFERNSRAAMTGSASTASLKDSQHTTRMKTGFAKPLIIPESPDYPHTDSFAQSRGNPTPGMKKQSVMTKLPPSLEPERVIDTAYGPQPKPSAVPPPVGGSVEEKTQQFGSQEFTYDP